MESRLPSLVKPTIETLFKIDFEWWKKRDQEWRVFMRRFLCPEHQEKFAEIENDEQIDWVDPVTAEVLRVDALQHTLITHCAKQDEFLTGSNSLVASVFRIFLANGNRPMSCQELSIILNRPAETILRTFATRRVYKGIRPIAT